MTVTELISALQDLDDPDKEVVFAYNYGDRSRTTVAQEVSRVDEERVCHSDYHNMDKLVDEDADEERLVDVRDVVVLR